MYNYKYNEQIEKVNTYKVCLYALLIRPNLVMQAPERINVIIMPPVTRFHIALQCKEGDKESPIVSTFGDQMQTKTGRTLEKTIEDKQVVMRVDFERDDLLVDVVHFQRFLDRFKKNFQTQKMQLEWTMYEDMRLVTNR